MGMGSGRRTTTNTLETGIRPELPGHVPGGQEDHQHGQRRHHQPRGQGGRPPGAGTGGELGEKEIRSENEKRNYLPWTDHPQERVRHHRGLGGAGLGVKGAVDTWNKILSKAKTDTMTGHGPSIGSDSPG